MPVGGVGAMLASIALAGVLSLIVTLVLHRSGWRWAIAVGLLVWSLASLAALTLLPANGSPGIVPAEYRSATCSTDIGGPAPDGFWILSGGQRTLNVAAFVPSGILLVLVAARFRLGRWLLVPFGLVGLAGYSVAIELIQLELARLNRACDLTDIIDNSTGALIGVLVGIPLAALLRASRWGSRAGRRRSRAG